MTESSTLPLFVYPHFLCTTCVVTVCTVKKMWRGVMSRSYFTSCPSENTAFGQTRTRQKRTEKSRKHLLRRASDSHYFFCRLTPANFFRRWQIQLAVISSTWQASQLHTTWQVDWSPCPLATIQFTWQVITYHINFSSQLEQSSYHASIGPCFISRSTWLLYRWIFCVTYIP